jgi:hypothetical protein
LKLLYNISKVKSHFAALPVAFRKKASEPKKGLFLDFNI